jgi:hypothetical protein
MAPLALFSRAALPFVTQIYIVDCHVTASVTRTTVYHGRPNEYDDEPLADLYHDHESGYKHAVVVETTDGEVFKVPESEACDIYIDGEPVDD